MNRDKKHYSYTVKCCNEDCQGHKVIRTLKETESSNKIELDRRGPMPEWCKIELNKMVENRSSRKQKVDISSDIDHLLIEQIDLCIMRSEGRHTDVAAKLEQMKNKRSGVEYEEGEI